jgi:hypothetical protein
MYSFFKQRHAVHRESEHLISLVVGGFPIDHHRAALQERLAKRSAASIRKIAQSASCFARGQNAGILSRAYLANRVRWGLKDRGYDDEFVRSITASVVMAMDAAVRS